MIKKKQKKKIIIANWKMAPQSFEEAKNNFSHVRSKAKDLKKLEIVICPPDLYISAINQLKLKPLSLGAQNVFEENTGTHTGQINIEMLKSSNASTVLVGHSEIRSLGESDEVVNKKIQNVVRSGCRAVLCIGEKERDNEADYLSFVKNQIESGLKGVQQKNLSQIIIAYEPVWAIGKKEEFAITPEDLHQMVIYIRKVLSDLYKRANIFSIPILYGGSTAPENAKDLIEKGDADGLLVGHVSLNQYAFVDLLKRVN